MIPRTQLPSVCAMLIATELLMGRGAYAAEIYIEDAPPPPRSERMPPPHDGLVWAAGHWEWSGKAFYWVEGTWLVERRKQHWVPAQWEHASSKWHFLPGHWDH
jgi:WXXGXW repeat (2 copies)